MRYTRVPVLTFAIPCGDVESKCQNHKEHEQAYVSRLAFAPDVWLKDGPLTETKRQVRYTNWRKPSLAPYPRPLQHPVWGQLVDNSATLCLRCAGDNVKITPKCLATPKGGAYSPATFAEVGR